ncbi:hypothetical protein VTP01DRAFT_7238 [Rhizomucor pusillus]|uniref:uncharacterized protein n=1 Tax=Rhizomucor pusillus TaxID=4840 RepID=UPI0037433FE5
MDYVVDEEVYALQTRNHESVATHVDKPKDKDICMRERIPKRAYTIYTDQDRVRFFKLIFEKVLSASAAAKQLGIHVRSAQRWASKYEDDPDSIFEMPKNRGCPRILNEEHKKVILEHVDENPSIVLEQLMERQLQRCETLHRFVKKECNLSLKKARFQPVDRNSEATIQERLDWVRKWDMTDIDFKKNWDFCSGYSAKNKSKDDHNLRSNLCIWTD